MTYVNLILSITTTNKLLFSFFVLIIGENVFVLFQFCFMLPSVIGVFKGGVATNDEYEKLTM